MEDKAIEVREIESLNEISEYLLARIKAGTAGEYSEETDKDIEFLDRIIKIRDNHLKAVADAALAGVRIHNERNQSKQNLINSVVKIGGTLSCIGLICAFEKSSIFTGKGLNFVPKLNF